AAAEGLPALCLHPPGENADAYYQVALSRRETGAVVVPALPARLHPGVAAVRAAVAGGELGAFRGLRLEAPVEPGTGDLIGRGFSRAVDVVRAVLGEIETVTATGDPPGDRPSEDLVVQLRGPAARRAEVHLWAGPSEPARLTATGADGTLTLEFDPEGLGPGLLVRRMGPGGAPRPTELEPWDARAAMLEAFAAAVAGAEVHPDLTDGTRALEVAAAAARSLRRGRTVDLHYEEVSEAGNFKAVMTSLGCLVLLATLVALPLALAGPALGLDGTLVIAYAIPPALVGFLLLQLFRFAVREGGAAGDAGAARRGRGPTEG
ncbi:MAG TPA: hypothetical protein VF590_20480, partial [Isosphaeraceae bacterium]